MIQTLLIIAIVILACVFLDKISERIGVPMLLAFIFLGMFFGSDGAVKIAFDNYSVAEDLCSVALIFIMFYGGFGTNWREAEPIAGKAVLLSTAGVLITAGLTGWLCHSILRFSWMESFLLGALVSSTDAASVFSILRSRQLNLKYKTASLLEVESGSNDPCAYMLTVICITLVQGGMDGMTMLGMVVAQILFGVICGVFCAFLAIIMLRRDEFSTDGFDIIFTVGIAVLAYALPQTIGGNGYLSVYILGIILGNSEISNKSNLVHFFDGLTGLMQILIFFLLGLLAFPSRLPAVFVPALVIALLLTFVVRPIAVSLILIPFRSRFSQIFLVSWSGLRGAASIVFAIMATKALQTEMDLYHIVFLIVIFSILLQGTLLPFMAKLSGMIDANENVMKTFNDYSNEVPVQFVQLTLSGRHEWCGKKLSDIIIPPDTLIVLLKRDMENIIPNGDTVLLENDTLILSAPALDKISGIQLIEKRIEKSHRYVGMSLAELPRKENELVIMIQRMGEIIIPNGNVILQPEDVLVINRSK